MFKGKTAWFSSSVGQGVTSFWEHLYLEALQRDVRLNNRINKEIYAGLEQLEVSEGGALSSWNTAKYLFSDDASSEDTKRIYHSEDYANNRATVFHSNFLSACIPRQSVKSVPIGHYVLPPDSIQNEMRVVIGRFIWEKDEQVMCEEQLKTEVSEDSLSDETEDQPVREKNSLDDYKAVASPNKVCSCCEMRQYPINNMIAGYAHIDQMKKYSGELNDFLPSLHGNNVSRSNNATPPYCHKEM